MSNYEYPCKSNSSSREKLSTKNLALTGMFTAVICVMAQIALPVSPVPFTLQLIAVLLAGAILPPRLAFFSVFIYLLLGAVGLPVYANFSGGISALVGPTGGYLMTFPIMALVTALFYKYMKKYKLMALILGMLVSLLLCYLFGTAWFTVTNTSGYTFMKALSICVYPFILFDLIKIVLAISLSTVIRRALKAIYS